MLRLRRGKVITRTYMHAPLTRSVGRPSTLRLMRSANPLPTFLSSYEAHRL